MKIFKNFFRKKKILITGHTGFKGSWLTLWLSILGAKVIGFSNKIPTRPAHFELLKLKKIINYTSNLENKKYLQKIIKKHQPDFIFHLAAQSLVKKSYTHTLHTWHSNLIGTINLLEILREYKKKINVILITSDKVYKNIETKKGYKENDNIGGLDPYGASKSATEFAIKSYIKSFFNRKRKNVSIAIARAGNVIGGGDWSQDRIIPDCIKAWTNNKKVKIRNPNSTRPWQHVLEVLNGYLTLAIKLKKDKKIHGEAFNFGPDSKNNFKVIEILKISKQLWKNVKWKIIKNKKVFYENRLLNLNNNKSKKVLKWKPILSFFDTIKLTIDWYINYFNKKNVYELSLKQINYFEFLKNKK